MRVTTEDSYFVLDGGPNPHGNGDLPEVGMGLG